MRIYSVNQVVVVRTSESPLTLTIHAMGMASTSGWTNPRLDPSGDPNPQDAILEFSFEADRPTGLSLPVLTPIQTTVEIKPQNGAYAVIVHARTNSVTVHASAFMGPVQPAPAAQAMFTTLAVGEENPPPTTLAVGEEHPTT